jgi:hypothetical protein
VTEKCVRRRLASTEFCENVHCLDSSTKTQNGVTEFASHLLHFFFIVKSNILECSECICGHNFSPFVRIVSSCIPSSKNVAKGTKEAVFVERHGVGCALLGNTTVDIKSAFAFPFIAASASKLECNSISKRPKRVWRQDIIPLLYVIVVVAIVGFVEFHGVVRWVIGCAVRIIASRFSSAVKDNRYSSSSDSKSNDDDMFYLLWMVNLLLEY